jgi:predicted nuclease with RNAse H fold
LAKFAPARESLGAWTDGHGLRVIEAYPALAKTAKVVQHLHLDGRLSKFSEDINDASLCALMAWLFENQRESLDQPPDSLPPDEGWIWVPKSDAH